MRDSNGAARARRRRLMHGAGSCCDGDGCNGEGPPSPSLSLPLPPSLSLPPSLPLPPSLSPSAHSMYSVVRTQHARRVSTPHAILSMHSAARSAHALNAVKAESQSPELQALCSPPVLCASGHGAVLGKDLSLQHSCCPSPPPSSLPPSSPVLTLPPTPPPPPSPTRTVALNA